jgi:conjugal transfer/entry exclusion protein
MNKQELQIGNIVLPNVYEPRRSDTITIQTINKDKRIQELEAEIAILMELLPTEEESEIIIDQLKYDIDEIRISIEQAEKVKHKIKQFDWDIHQKSNDEYINKRYTIISKLKQIAGLRGQIGRKQNDTTADNRVQK